MRRWWLGGCCGNEQVPSVHYVNQGCSGQLPPTVHIQLFQPACSSDKENVWKWLPLGSSPQLYVFQGIRDGWAAIVFSSPFQLCAALAWHSLQGSPAAGWKQAEQYERETFKMSEGLLQEMSSLNTPLNKRVSTPQIQYLESKRIHLKYALIKCWYQCETFFKITV